MLVLSVAGCSRVPVQRFIFEPAPRAVSAAAGAASARFAKVALDPVSSATTYLLTIAGPEHDSRLVLMMSPDGGDTYAAPVAVSAFGQRADSHGEDAPSLVLRDNILAAWDQDGDIRFGRSLTFGASFEKPVPIRDRQGPFFSGYVSVAAAPNGDLYAVWLDTRDSKQPYDTFSVYIARSKDHGKTFGRNVRVALAVCECCHPGIAFGPQGEVMVFYRAKFPGNVRDMAVAISRDHGDTFDPPNHFAGENWKLDGCPDSGVTTARSGSRIYAAWLSEPSAERAGILLAWTDDGGRTWSPALLASQKIREANYAALAADSEGHVVLAFQGRDPDKDGGWSAVAPYVVDISPNGSLADPQPVPGVLGPVMRPAIGMGTGGRIFVAWTTTDAGQTSVVVSRARRL